MEQKSVVKPVKNQKKFGVLGISVDKLRILYQKATVSEGKKEFSKIIYSEVDTLGIRRF